MIKCVPVSCIFILFFSFFQFQLSAQTDTFTSQDLGVLEEYTNPQVTSLYQDRRGLLWISTYGGMDRWDGKRMVHYPYMPFDSTGSPARIPGGFTDDDQNNIWFLGEGLMKFDLETEVFHRIPIRYQDADLDIRYVKFDSKGFLWLGAMDGIYKYYPRTDSLRKVPILNSDEIEESWFRKISILRDSTGSVWMSHNLHGLCYYDPESDVFRKQAMDLPDFVDKHMNVGVMKEDPQGNFWLLGRKTELARFNPHSREFQWANLPVYSSVAPSSWGGIAIDHLGRIWFGADRGLMLYDPRKEKLTPLDTLSSLSYVIDMITDKQGNILVGTLEGVKVINPREITIRTIDVHLEQLIEGVGWYVSVVRDEQFLWMGTFRAGLIRYNLENDQFTNYQADGQPGSINSNYITKTLRDRSGRIWFTAGWDGSLYRVNEDKDSFEHFRPGDSHYITQGVEGYFWILGRERISRFDPITLDTRHIRFKEALPVDQLRSQLDFIPFIRDKEGIFWFAQQDGGLYRIDPEGGSWTHYNYDKSNPNGLPDPHVKSLFCDSRGTIWLSTWVGLSKLIKDPVNDTVLTFDNQYITDLKLGHSSRITEDAYGNIFVVTLYGVIVIRTDGTVETYSEQDGLLKDPSRTWLVDRDHENGAIYLGGSKMVIVPPGFLAIDTSIVQTILTEFRILGEAVVPGELSPLKKSILVADRIDLRHDQNFFRIDFAATFLSHPERNRYRYFLEGIDEDTLYSGNKSFAEYTDLKSGNYTFWVSGASHRGPWNPEGRSIEIIIHPPWYGSMAAKSGYFISMLLLVMVYVRFRTEKLRKEKIILENLVNERTAEIQQKNEKIVEMEDLKTRFFTDISHEIRTPLSMISGPLENLINEHPQSEKSSEWLDMIKRNSQRLLQLVNQLLDISRLDSGHMKLVLEKSDILKHIRVLVNEYHSLAEKNHICYVLDLPEEDLSIWNDRDKIHKILTNLLSNAFKFTPEFGTVTCRVKVLTKAQSNLSMQLRIIVADTGPGIPQQAHRKIFDRFYRSEGDSSYRAGGAGIGLSITRDMVDLLHGEIRVKSLVGTGTVFMVTIPLGKKHLDKKEYIIKDQTEPGPGEVSVQPKPGESFLLDGATGTDQTILIVEDNDEVRSFIKENLQPKYKILEAEDGLKGLSLATSAIPDVIISDIMMPGLDGKELCEKLKKDERTSHIPLIMLTARATTHDKIEGLECGADDYIFKPFSMEEIETRICNLLQQRERLRLKYSGYIGLDWNKITITTLDEEFLKKTTGIISRHLHEFEFDVGALQEEMAVSDSTLYKKLKVLTGESPNSLIRIMRLKRAASLLEKNELSITEILMSVGFSNPSYFTRCFKAYFGVTPREYQRSFN
ncbi:MAG: hypothetical protein DRJ29_05600 [Bacteroidetes bacterium]|nr:MAG: hypothetical protein DRI98_02145 [Bacteroidota bacterium]RLD94503.1 MAG: hypothetical protein DRJ29_05600 [Bacteroidota bacterium]